MFQSHVIVINNNDNNGNNWFSYEGNIGLKLSKKIIGFIKVDGTDYGYHNLDQRFK